MKREWTATELVMVFGMTREERHWVRGSAAHNRLGLAVMLKVFQYQGRFPQHLREVPPAVVTYIAQQVEVLPEIFDSYEWMSRTGERHRRTIREREGFHQATVSDVQTLVGWLAEQPIMRHDHDIASLKELAYQRLYQLHIEPPTPDRLERTIRSAVRHFEQGLFEAVYQAISARSLLGLDSLVSTTPADEEDERAFHHSLFLKLKRDPARMSLRAVIEEVEKLELFQTVDLPDDLFSNLTPKLISKYRQRASAESPRELRNHPKPIRYTLLAAFCWQRRREVIDNLVDLLNRIIRKMHIRAEQRVEAAYALSSLIFRRIRNGFVE